MDTLYTKKELVGAVVDALRPLTVRGGGYVRQLEAGTSGAGDKSPLDAAVQLPALLVSYTSSTYSRGQYKRLMETVGIEVTVVQRVGLEPVPEKVLDDVRGILAGLTIGPGVGPMTLLRETPIPAGPQRAAATALYSLTRAVPDGE